MKIKLSLLVAVVGLLTTASCGRQSPPSPPPVSIGGSGGGQSSAPASAGAEKEAPKSEVYAPDGELSSRRNFYVIFDGSGSMQGKIDPAKDAVKGFMKSVPQDVNLGLFVFDSRGVREVLPLGPNNREAFLREVDRVDVGGGTPLGDSIMAGSNALLTQYKKQLGYGEYRLVVVTDGDPQGGRVDFKEAIEYARQAKIPIYAIGYQVPGSNHPLRDRRYTVSYREASDAKSLQKGLEEVLAETETFDAQSFEELYRLLDKK